MTSLRTASVQPSRFGTELPSSSGCSPLDSPEPSCGHTDPGYRDGDFWCPHCLAEAPEHGHWVYFIQWRAVDNGHECLGYIGVTSQLRARLTQHQSKPHAERFTDWTATSHPSRRIAEAWEAFYIDRYCPPLNKKGVPARRPRVYQGIEL